MTVTHTPIDTHNSSHIDIDIDVDVHIAIAVTRILYNITMKEEGDRRIAFYLF